MDAGCVLLSEFLIFMTCVATGSRVYPAHIQSASLHATLCICEWYVIGVLHCITLGECVCVSFAEVLME